MIEFDERVSYDTRNNTKQIDKLYRGQLHCDDGPARIIYKINSRKQEIVWQEYYYKNGKMHREHDPALISHDIGKSGYFTDIKYAYEGITYLTKEYMYVGILNNQLINQDLKIIYREDICSIINVFTEETVCTCKYEDLEKELTDLLTK